ncbi:hypothetical protein, partial [uncultured Corynebacterium sp.]
DGTRISDPVELRVQSVPGLSSRGVTIIAGLLLGIGAAGKMLWDRRSGRASKRKTATALRPAPRPQEGDQN